MKYKIYIIKNSVNDKMYIGQTAVSFEQRWSWGYRGCQKIYAAIQELGKDKFYYVFLDEADDQTQADNMEKDYIVYFQTRDDRYGYNIAIGGGSGGMQGRNHTEEAKQKLSASKTGRAHSKETKQKISASLSGDKHPMYGKHFSEEHKQKLSASHIGKTSSDEARKKMSEAQTGEKNHNFGKHLSDEAKQKLSETNAGENNPLSKLTWEQVNEIRNLFNKGIKRKILAEKYNVSYNNIRLIILNKRWKI